MNAPSPNSTGSRLIARIWHGVTDAARADEYAAYLERTGARECGRHPAIGASTCCGASSRIAPSSRSFRCGIHSRQSGASPERIMRKPTTTRKTAISSSGSNPSSTTTRSSPEINLDPTDARGWEELRLLGHRMVDEMLEY